MDPVVEEVNQLGRCFWHLLSMDGLEIAATTMCGTDDAQCVRFQRVNWTELTFPTHYDLDQRSKHRCKRPKTSYWSQMAVSNPAALERSAQRHIEYSICLVYDIVYYLGVEYTISFP